MEMYQIDAFASRVFTGNPAAILLIDDWLPTEKMQAIAMENNLSETAFVVDGPGGYHIRWFTPNAEVKLCGHATLAAGHMFYEHLGYQEASISFDSLSGKLSVTRTLDGYELDFPVDRFREDNDARSPIADIIGAPALDVVLGSDDYLVRVESQDQVDAIKPDLRKLAQMDVRGLLVTALGKEVDFVSRGFFPAYGIDEDPVTGSAHTLLTPYWAEQTQRESFIAEQRSARGGRLICQLRQDRVAIAGQAVTYSHSTIFV